MKTNTLEEPRIEEEIQGCYHDLVVDLLDKQFVGILETHFEKGRIVRLKRHETCVGADPNWVSPGDRTNLLNEHFELVSGLAKDEFFGIIESFFDACGLFLIKKHQTFLGKDIIVMGR